MAGSGARRRLAELAPWLTAAACLLGIALGGVLHLAGAPAAGDAAWLATAAMLLAPLTWSVARTLLARDVGVDAIALVAIAGAVALREELAGAVVALMLSGGNALEAYAAGRARRELKQLVERAPRTGRRRRGDEVEEVPVEELAVGDLVVVRSGEVVPVDGLVATAEAVLDESALTGEPLPVVHPTGDAVRSGTLNSGGVFELRASRSAADSAYALLVRLVRESEAHRATFVRLADRYAAVMLPLTLAAAGIAWAASGDAVRALAVLVVATPCPLILAAPIAFICGVSRAAGAGVIVKGGAAIEKLGTARTVLLDKTGTLTLGAPAVERVLSLDGVPEDELLRLAASLDQLSTHPLAAALVAAARQRGLPLAFPEQVVEGHGQGIEGLVEGRRVTVGSPEWLDARGCAGAEAAAQALDALDGADGAKIAVALDGTLAGGIAMGDHLREDAPAMIGALRRAGIRHVALVTGDRAAVADAVGAAVGVDRVYAEQSPEEKLEVVQAMQARPELRSVVMVGDGINDAPALALADVGIAMGAAGATVSSETADAVIVVDRIDRVATAIAIGRRSLGIARESVLWGLGLSLLAMVFAGLGLIPPVFGALLQEGIDVAVILNALRALRPGRTHP
ncbi:MAG: heavy metal translocating P-type ATPase [Thermoleophilia bacterium]